MNYSVLMSVYHKEIPTFLESSMESIFAQTVPTNDFVLICDGPLTDELDCVITRMSSKFGNRLNVVRLPKNVGLGRALNEGIKYCKHDLVARMDSDDISYPDRCERQLKVFENHSEISICSGIVEEFDTTPEHITARRVLPETQPEILEFSKKRNPFNHPCVMYRKSAVETSGGYQDFYLLEDYYLWLRMLLNGNKGYNLQEPLLWMRAGSNMYKRRSGWEYAKSQMKLFKFMKNSDLIGYKGYVFSCTVRTLSSIAPNWLRQLFFIRFLRHEKRINQ